MRKKGFHHSRETVEKLRKVAFGRKLSEETKDKIRDTLTGRKNPKGRNESTFKSGSSHPLWKGGISLKKEYAPFMARQRQIRKLGNGGSHSLGEWNTLKAQYNFTCPSCRKREPEIRLSQDHIIPLSKGGSDNIENIQPLCRLCNSKKNTKIIKYESIIR